MGKIICDICGTSYPDTAEQCPICGCTREAAAQMLGEDLLLDETLEEEKGKGGHFSSKKKKEIFDFDEANSQPREQEEEEGSFSEGEDEEEEEDRPNTFVVILLTVLIAALLIAAGFLFVKFILPNMGDKGEAEAPAQQTQMQTLPGGETGSIPCETLVLSSGNKAVLTQQGGLFLLHVNAIPSDTTDVITFASADESVATVSQDGRIEAVSEGETVVTITCGTRVIECQVVVQYEQETVPPTEGEASQPTAGTPAEGNETVPPTTKAPSDIKLKLKKTDIKLGVGYEFQLVLDCDLEQNQVEWSSEHPYIVSVDESGVVKALKWGTTSVTAKYGDQEVSCIVRCG